MITLNPGQTIADAAAIFDSKKIHHIPIVKNKRLVGIVSKSDYLLFKHGFLDTEEEKRNEIERLKKYNLECIMTRGIAKLEPSDRINVALEIFKENIFHAIPVIENHELIGILTTYDIIRKLADDNMAEAKY